MVRVVDDDYVYIERETHRSENIRHACLTHVASFAAVAPSASFSSESAAFWFHSVTLWCHREQSEYKIIFKFSRLTHLIVSHSFLLQTRSQCYWQSQALQRRVRRVCVWVKGVKQEEQEESSSSNNIEY